MRSFLTTFQEMTVRKSYVVKTQRSNVLQKASTNIYCVRSVTLGMLQATMYFQWYTLWRGSINLLCLPSCRCGRWFDECMIKVWPAFRASGRRRRCWRRSRCPAGDVAFGTFFVTFKLSSYFSTAVQCFVLIRCRMGFQKNRLIGVRTVVYEA